MQTLIIGIALTASVVYLAISFWPRHKPSSGCCGCTGKAGCCGGGDKRAAGHHHS